MTQMSGPMVNENIQCFIDCANELVRHDEVARALWLLDNMPAWRRDNPHPEIISLRNEIMARIATPSFYATDRGSELESYSEVHLAMRNSLRGDFIVKEIKNLNNHGFEPNFYDLGPGEFWTPKLLISENLKFGYSPIWVNQPSYAHYLKDFEKAIKPHRDDMPTIFYACEIIEHLWKEDELRFEMNRRISRMADIIHFSTPLHTFDTSCLDWRTARKDLGHLRAYTPAEFFLTIQRLFPEYDLTIYHSQPMHIRGTLRDTKFDLIKNTQASDIIGMDTRG